MDLPEVAHACLNKANLDFSQPLEACSCDVPTLPHIGCVGS